jgi:7-carboxy-7-deazaguanine synthase
MSRKYAINEIFLTLQGEGVRTGTANVFCRFAGCNLACDVEASPLSPGGFACDTEFTSHRLLTADELLAEVTACAGPCRWIVLTGGEPSLQVDQALVDALHGAGYQLAIETNGTKNLEGLGLDWVCVSPKTAEHTLRQLTADEVKYVRATGQGLPQPKSTAAHYLISPAFEPDGMVRPETLRWCIQLCKDHPPWRLSLQLHKWLRIR